MTKKQKVLTIIAVAIAFIIGLVLGSFVITGRLKSSADIPIPGGGKIETVKLYGKITFPNGNIASGAKIYLNQITQDPSGGSSISYNNETTADSNGNYAIWEVPVGKNYRLIVNSGGGSLACNVYKKDINPFEIQNSPNAQQKQDIVLDEISKGMVSFKGAIKDIKTGKGIAEAKISYKDDQGNFVGYISTDKDGKFQTPCEFSPKEEQTFQASASSYKPQEQIVNPPIAGEFPLNFDLEPGGQAVPGGGQGGDGNRFEPLPKK